MKIWRAALADYISLFANAKKDSETNKTDAAFVHCSGMHCYPATLEAVFGNDVSSVPVGGNILSTGGELCDHL